MYYFIVNPASGSGKGRAVWNTVRRELDRRKIAYRSFLLTRSGEARALAAGLAEPKHPVTVIVVGGDGTINEVMSGLRSFHNITFGCIPTGSGNDFVRGLGLARDPLRALDAILHPEEIRRINIGSMDGGQQAFAAGAGSAPAEYVTSDESSRQAFTAGAGSSHAEQSPSNENSRRSFAVSAGFGYDAAVCHCVNKSRLKNALNRFRLGKLVYLFTALRLLLTMKRRTIEAVLDDGKTITFRSAYFAAVMNLRYEGGGFKFAPGALPDDGFLDLVVANRISRLRVLYLLPLALTGRHVGHRGIHILRCRKAILRADRPLAVHTDGESPCFSRSVTFSLRDEKLAVILR